MPVHTHYLDWSTPALPSAADHLVDKHSDENGCDLSHLLVVLPSRRAGRRLLEILALKSQPDRNNGAPFLLSPPRIITIGELPELLLRVHPDLLIATEEETNFARVAAMRSMNANELRQVFAVLPDADDFLAWYAIAEELAALDSELAGEDVSYDALRNYCSMRNLDAAKRWRVLDKIARKTDELLAESNRISRPGAIRQALAGSENIQLRHGLNVVLIGTVDLNTTTCRLLEASRSKVLVLIHAPQNEAHGFREFGQLQSEYWQEKTIELNHDEIHIVTRASDQAHEIVEMLQSLRGVDDDAITVGLGEEKLAPCITRGIENCGRVARHGTGNPLAQSAPAGLLRALADFWSEPRPEYFAAVLRHPDFDVWFQTQLKLQPQSKCLVALWDEYSANHLPPVVKENSAHLPVELQRVLGALQSLLPQPSSERRLLRDWAEPIAGLLRQLYGEQKYSAHNQKLYAAFEELGKLLQQIAMRDESTPFAAHFSWCEALRWVLSLAASTPLPAEQEGSAVELVGWLEVHLDDAPILFVTGFNEGAIPDSSFVAPFLTDSLRRHFGLVDNQRRYARDAYLLAATRACRKKFHLLCSRRSLDNEPLQPSRLLFACDAVTAAMRAREFFREEENPKSYPISLPSAEKNQLAQFARPLPLPTPFSELRVTAFRDYLACPYRFYLRHICKLETTGSPAPEMDGSLFGTLLHEVLSNYALLVIEEKRGIHSRSAEDIFVPLAAALHRAKKRRFGTESSAAVELQVHQIERRLQAFAKQQASLAESGWRTLCVETNIEKVFDVNGLPFRVYGRVDRIDYNEDFNTLRILDYKTGDKKRTPEQTHRTGKKEERIWRDLQLPLYHRLAPECDAISQVKDARIEVGYLCLPAKTGETGVEIAEWEDGDFSEAYAVADEVMQNVQQQRYWPPGEPALFEDSLDALCFDAERTRHLLINEPSEKELFWPMRVAGRSSGFRSAP